MFWFQGCPGQGHQNIIQLDPGLFQSEDGDVTASRATFQLQIFFYTLISSLEMTLPLQAGVNYITFVLYNLLEFCSHFLICYLTFVKLPLSDMVYALDHRVAAILFLAKLI